MASIGRILVAMSGGVDSSVAAALLQEKGYDIVGVTLHLWDAQGETQVGRCCAPEDRDDARKSCEYLGVSHYVIDEREKFHTQVVEPFLDEYRSGRTPSPCVHCNRTVKLVHLTSIADQLGCSHIATGHYAQIRHDPGGIRLLKGRDRQKDQSYFLFGLPQETLERVIFPLGDMIKDEARGHARRLGLPNADKADSQELCFVPDGNIKGFVQRHRGPGVTGVVRDSEGEILGAHDGVERFTIGQRRGLGLGGGGKGPRFVLRIVGEDVVLGRESELFSERLDARDVSWLHPTESIFDAQVRIRYRHKAASARIERTQTGFSARFHEPQRAITPGQAAVVYRGEEVLGGGFIV